MEEREKQNKRARTIVYAVLGLGVLLVGGSCLGIVGITWLGQAVSSSFQEVANDVPP